MAQSTDLVVPNTSGAGVRSGINTRLQAIATHQSGATAPSTTYAYQFWADTTAGLLKQRDGSNANWISLGTLATLNLGHAPLASPNFTGTPTAPTAAVGTSTTQLATTAFVAANKLVAMTVQNSTSGTSIDFTGIPSWVKRVTVMFNGVSTSGTSGIRIQLGTSSGPETTGYVGANLRTSSSSLATAANSSGFDTGNFSAQTEVQNGHFILSQFQASTNTWTCSGTVGGGTITNTTAGIKPLAGALDRVRITTVNGTDSFDAGSINILYE